ncbi:MAG: NAD(+) diphosphatase, partial [Wenzhouxiangellaceae bacterium]
MDAPSDSSIFSGLHRQCKPVGVMTDTDLQYAGAAMDRAHPRRDDPDWLKHALRHPETRFVPVWRDRSLIVDRPEQTPAAARLRRAHMPEVDEHVFLGLEQGAARFAADLSGWELDQVEALTEGVRLADLRAVGPALPYPDATLLAYARGMTIWHRTHQHCGICGSLAESQRAGHVRVCTGPECGRTLFPRTDPAVIMLVEHPDSARPRCLLGRPKAFPPGMYSTLAGFVEPGESLEQAVAREVFEESSVELDEIRYIASQPWPFPSSIMIGFHAGPPLGR